RSLSRPGRCPDQRRSARPRSKSCSAFVNGASSEGRAQRRTSERGSSGTRVTIVAVVVWGVLALVFGLAFAVQPLAVARFTSQFRFVPYPASPSRQQMRYFRAVGLAIAMAGVVVLLLS